jgi:sugar phosphate isomerase/epimerase
MNDLDATVAFALEHGFEVVDVGPRRPEEIKQILDAGLRIGSINLPQDWTGLASPDGAKRRDCAQAQAEFIRSLSTVVVTNYFVVAIPEDETRPRSENFSYAVDGYGRLCEAIEATGAKIVLEGWPGRAPYFSSLACTPGECRAFLKEVGADALGLNFDPSHLVRMGVDPVRFLEEFVERVFHAHGKDTELLDEGRYEHGVQQPSAHVEPPPFSGLYWRYALPGHGCVRWQRLLEILSSSGYSGAISIELEDKNFNGAQEGEQRGLRASLEFLSQV